MAGLCLSKEKKRPAGTKMWAILVACSVLAMTIVIIWRFFYHHTVHLHNKLPTAGYIAPTLVKSIRQDGFFDFDGDKRVDAEETAQTVHIVFYREKLRNQLYFLFKQKATKGNALLELPLETDFLIFPTETQRFCYYWLAQKVKCAFELLVNENDSRAFGADKTHPLQFVTLEELASKTFIEQHFEDPVTRRLLNQVLLYQHILT